MIAGPRSAAECGSAGTTYVLIVIVWLNGTHGVGKTTTSKLVQHLIPGSRVLDAAALQIANAVKD
jgi:hypothetical protein